MYRIPEYSIFTPDYFFLEFIHQDKLISFQETKITNFFSIVQGSAREKTYKLLSIRCLTLVILNTIMKLL